MSEVISIGERSKGPEKEDAASDPSHSAEVRAFPGARQLRMIETIAAHMATLGEVEARRFLVFHFEVVELSRLVEQGVSDPEIDRYIFTTARAIWSRVRKIQAGAA
jgi:hypothetical protein